jgi:hypothetical protein
MEQQGNFRQTESLFKAISYNSLNLERFNRVETNCKTMYFLQNTVHAGAQSLRQSVDFATAPRTSLMFSGLP